MDKKAILVSLLLFPTCVASQNANPTLSDAAQYAEQLMKIQVEFTETVPPGVSIEAKEISRSGTPGINLVVQYHIFVKGVPTSTHFQEFQWPINADKPSPALGGISIGKDGILMCAGRTPEECGDPKKPDDPIEFITIPKKGEPTRLAFIASKIKIGVVLVPDPVEDTNRNCTLSAVRLTPEFELAFLSGSGYAPDSDVHYRVSSAKISDSVVRSDKNGNIRFSLVPYSANKSGIVSVKVTDTTCSPEVTYQWGTF